MPSKYYCSVFMAFALALSAVTEAWAQPTPPVAHENSIYDLKVEERADTGWSVNFLYNYTGAPSGVLFRIETITEAGTTPETFDRFTNVLPPPQLGVNGMIWSLQYPGEGTSTAVLVSMVTPPPDSKVVASQRIEQIIEWPPEDEYKFRKVVEDIDSGRDALLYRARTTIQGILARNPQFDPGYVELARIAMKTNWGPAGLHQAETLLDSALKIRPDSVNAKILLGYVYAHQKRFRDAERLFSEAARENPPNLWLWTNWGELLEMQGQLDQAQTKYREAIGRRPDRDNRRPRQSAYSALFKLLERQDDSDGLEALYETRLAENGGIGCQNTDYARFKLNVRRDPQAAIDLARGRINGACDDAKWRQVVGLANYAKWAETSGDDSAEALNQARVFLPPEPLTLRLLASNESTLPAAERLIATGEAIDQKDNQGMTALALALQSRELEAAARLLALGASPESPVTEAAIPVALLPVIDGDLAAIALFRRAGVDYSRIRYNGATAIDFAKQLGDEALLEALTAKGRTL